MEDTNKDMNIDKEEAKKVKKVKKEKKARKRGRKGRIVAQIFVCFLLTVAFVASAAGGAVAAYYKAATNTITTDTKTALKNVDVVDADLEYDQDVVNILLIGCDKRADETEAGRSDSTMIATIDLKNGKLKLTSLMRDMYIDIPGYGYHKFNAAYSYGGVQLEYETIAENFGIKLDGYVEVGFEAFEKIVNSVGGVEVELTESEANYLNTTNYISKKKYRHVKVGKQILNGNQALGYCRIRKGGTFTVTGLTDDYGRTWRQRAVITAVFDKVKALPATKWLEIANNVLDGYVTTDLSNDKILEYITDVVKMGTTKVYQLQIPVNGYYRASASGEYSCGSSIVMTDGVNSTRDSSANAEALNKFIFDYNGKKAFKYGTFTAEQ